MTRLGILISGGGSNMAALVHAFPAQVAVVIANRADAPGLAKAAAAGVEALTIPHTRDRAAHERAIDAALRARGVGLVCLAGYMRLLTPYLVQAWAGRMLNVHPSLLPAFPGLDTHARAIAAGVKLHGCTVHQVTEVVDEGPILAQAAVPVLPGDTPEALAARVLRQEHRLYPAAVHAFLDGRPVPADAGAALLNPVCSHAPG